MNEERKLERIKDWATLAMQALVRHSGSSMRETVFPPATIANISFSIAQHMEAQYEEIAEDLLMEK